jgi:hypothetical protein
VQHTFALIFFQTLSLKLGAIGFKGKKMKIKEGRGEVGGGAKRE